MLCGNKVCCHSGQRRGPPEAILGHCSGTERREGVAGVHQLLTPFVWGMKNSWGGAGCPWASGTRSSLTLAHESPLLYFQEFCHLLKMTDSALRINDIVLEIR